MLHVAPEDTFQPLLTARGFRYVTTDLYADGVDVRADLTRLPFPDSRFALVVCGHVLEHVDDDRAALREVCRVLRPGGLALLLIPIDPGLDRTVDVPAGADPRDYGIEQIDHRRQYGRDAVDRIRAADLAVAGNYAGQLDPALVHRHAMSSAGMYVASRSGEGRCSTASGKAWA
ncbi:MAG: class I SAM-dependent methyltransferase [Mycobacteriales bacterium]